jgi:hypothetical protein
MRTVVFLDLDDTVFQTLPKCPTGAPIRPAAYRRDGAPLSFMTAAQRTLLDRLHVGATVIPTTARNLDAFRRVDIPFAHGAILDFGGVVLEPNGNLDPAWDAQVRPQTRATAGVLRELQHVVESLDARLQLEVRARVISDFDMPLYLVVKHPGGDVTRLVPVHDELCRCVDGARFFLHLNDNNLSVVPRFLGKERAVGYFLEHRLGGDQVLSIGVGDSLTDAPFLERCDFSLTPRGSQLARQWRREER